MDVKNTVTDASINQPISDVSVTALDSSGKILERTTSNKLGQWSMELSPETEFLRFQKDGYCRKDVKLDDNFPKLIRLLEYRIVSYLDKMWFYPGETIQAYISSPTEYSCKIIKYGFEKEIVADLGIFPPIIQNVPDKLFVEEGLSWSSTIKYSIPEITKSGLYGLLLQSKNLKEDRYTATFIVMPKPTARGSNSKILVLASTNNWQTYNIWGGRSRYRNFEAPLDFKAISKLKIFAIRFIPEFLKNLIRKLFKSKISVTVNDNPHAFQFKSLSIKRPHPNCSIEGNVNETFTSHLASGEWRILAWLEKEGYHYDLVSGYELHKNDDLLDNYDVLILSTHCEYWSKRMYYNLTNYHKNGGSIINLSGNSIYREIEFLEDSSIRCVSLRFADSVDDETKLIGVRFDMRGYGTCAPFKVLEPSNWVFEGTGLSKGDLFAVKCLNRPIDKFIIDFNNYPASTPGIAPLIGEGGSGWETDKISKTAPEDVILLAKGLNKKSGGSDMIIRVPDNEGIVFSASSITFGGCLLIDKISSKVVSNVINRATRRHG
jgi:hypothetical protein